ncbi:MAG: ATP-binding protein [Candidatus Cloacimonadota bacterium]|nr:ATP-binding protein [Candidatus Cloacimonadota bacterium]
MIKKYLTIIWYSNKFNEKFGGKLVIKSKGQKMEKDSDNHVTSYSKEALEKLQESEELFRHFVENVPGVVNIYKWFPDETRQSLFQGPGLEKIIGEKLAGKVKENIEEYFKLIPPEDFEKLDREAVTALKNDKKLKSEYRLVLSKNNVKWVQAHFSIFPQNDGSVLWQGIIFDITQQKRAERMQKILYKISAAVNETEKLKELYRKIRMILGKVIDATNFYIALYDKHTDTISLSYYVDKKDRSDVFPAGKTLTKYVIETQKPLYAPKYKIDELIHEGFVEELGTPAQIWLGVPLILENETIGVIAVQSYSDVNTYHRDDINLLSYVSGGIALAIKHIQTMENLKRTNEELHQLKENLKNQIEEAIEKMREKDHLLIKQSRNAAMGEMIGNIAHQWRQPLSAVAAIVQDIEDAYEYGELDEKYLHDSIEKTMHQISYMSQTIDDFRSFYKPNEERRYFSVQKVLKNTLKFVEKSFRAHNIKIDFTVKKDCSIKGFPNEYSQAILNILNNSKDAIIENKIEKGRLTIIVDQVDDRSKVTIGDNAGGIPENIIDRIFDPYFTTKEQGRGTGIGLYMAKMIIKQNMGGKIIVKNSDKGAHFTLIV